MHQLSKISTTRPERLRMEIEQRTTFTLNRCELNIFETHKRAEDVKLRFEGFTITSMLRGKKVLRLDEKNKLDYVPGETFILPSYAEMCIDFPEANYTNPTQCTALVIEDAYLKKQLDYINETFPRHAEIGGAWDLSLQHQFLQNDEMIVTLGNRLIKLFAGNDPMKDILVDIKLKELVLSIMRLQNLGLLDGLDKKGSSSNVRFRAVADYIRRNITADITVSDLSKIACMSKSVFYRAFTHEYGIPPNKMILSERIKYAKKLMDADAVKIKEVCFAAGFSDPNYFSRIFKKHEGITPGEYLGRLNKG